MGREHPLFEIEGVTPRFGGVVVLDGVDLVLEAGQAAAVVGPNGAGKTTLLRCAIGADHPDEGEVRLGGDPLRDTDPAVRAAIAAVLDDVEFIPDLSVAEHLDLIARAHGDPEPTAGFRALAVKMRRCPAGSIRSCSTRKRCVRRCSPH